MNFLGLRRNTSPWQSAPQPDKFTTAWTQMLKANQRAMIPKGMSEVLALGIPNESRLAVWTRLLGIGTFRPREVNPSKKIVDLIKCDIPRTFVGQRDPKMLYEVLVALTAEASPIGTYCQGLNYLGVIFLHAAGDDDRALDFSILGLEALLLKLDMKSYFFDGMRQLRADIIVLTNLIESTLPHVLPLFRRSGIELSYCVANWFLCLFSNIGLELSEVLRLWDYILGEGFEAVLRISIALLEHSLPLRSVAFIEHDDLARRVKSFSTDALTLLQLASAYSLPSKTELCKERRDAFQTVGKRDAEVDLVNKLRRAGGRTRRTIW
eukprot:GEMP01022796.1.p1 GENE.GEMP01022796.1~~GEMP01022796.1.p1  ORF type:complete len:323 (+),score=59.42 GEMP01022796.1:252-1220(+)